MRRLRLAPRTLALRLCLFIGAATCTVLAATAWLDYRASQAALEEQTDAEARKQVQAAAQDLDDFVGKVAILPYSIAARQKALGPQPDSLVPRAASPRGAAGGLRRLHRVREEALGGARLDAVGGSPELAVRHPPPLRFPRREAGVVQRPEADRPALRDRAVLRRGRLGHHHGQRDPAGPRRAGRADRRGRGRHRAGSAQRHGTAAPPPPRPGRPGPGRRLRLPGQPRGQADHPPEPGPHAGPGARRRGHRDPPRRAARGGDGGGDGPRADGRCPVPRVLGLGAAGRLQGRAERPRGPRAGAGPGAGPAADRHRPGRGPPDGRLGRRAPPPTKRTRRRAPSWPP